MGTIRRIIRGASLAWAVFGLAGFYLAVREPGSVMLASWAKVIAWPFAAGADAAGLGMLAANSLGQLVFYFGWIVPLLMTRQRKAREDFAPFTNHAGL